MDHLVSVTGRYPQFFKLSTERFVGVLPGEMKGFTVTLNLPDSIDMPGLHDHLICVLEAEGSGGGGIGTRTEMCATIGIRVLYDYKYLLVSDFIVAPQVDRGDVIPLRLTVKSWTKQDIESVKASIEILAPDEGNNFNFTKKITTVYTEEKRLPTNAEESLTAYLDTSSLEPGQYQVNAEVVYDGNPANRSTKFTVGSLTVKVVNYTKTMEVGKVGKFDIEIGSRWNNRIEKIYAYVHIGNDTLMTPFSSLDAWQNINLSTYWDLTEKKPGIYNGKIILYYGENTSETDININAVSSKIPLSLIILIAVVAVIIVMLIILIVILTSKSKNGKEKDKEPKSKKKQ
jgi:hypothetical protein